MTAFLAVFPSVFVAELGDKTQFATARFAADGQRSPCLIFLASSAALVASAGLAAIAGGLLGELVQAPALTFVAGGGFILIGVLMLWGGVRAT